MNSTEFKAFMDLSERAKISAPKLKVFFRKTRYFVVFLFLLKKLYFYQKLE